jgi:hypothetical protein
MPRPSSFEARLACARLAPQDDGRCLLVGQDKLRAHPIILRCSTLAVEARLACARLAPQDDGRMLFVGGDWRLGTRSHKIGGGPAEFPPSPLRHQPACKPGSVRRGCPRVTTIPLGRRLPVASSNLPGRPDQDIDPGPCARAPNPRRPYSVLLPVGFTVPPPLPATRCALTAPFHPCRGQTQRTAAVSVSVALSLGLHPPDVIRHRMSMEPGLSSRIAFRH